MVKKLTKHGDELALVIDRAMLDSLGLDEQSEIELTPIEGGVFLRKKNEDALPADFQDTVARLNDAWGPVFKKLAE